MLPFWLCSSLGNTSKTETMSQSALEAIQQPRTCPSSTKTLSLPWRVTLWSPIERSSTLKETMSFMRWFLPWTTRSFKPKRSWFLTNSLCSTNGVNLLLTFASRATPLIIWMLPRTWNNNFLTGRWKPLNSKKDYLRRRTLVRSLMRHKQWLLQKSWPKTKKRKDQDTSKCTTWPSFWSKRCTVITITALSDS